MLGALLLVLTGSAYAHDFFHGPGDWNNWNNGDHRRVQCARAFIDCPSQFRDGRDRPVQLYQREKTANRNKKFGIAVFSDNFVSADYGQG